MKKLTSLLLSAVLLVSMLACGASAKTNTKVRIAGLKGPTTMGLVNLLSMEKEGTASLDYDLQLYGAADEIVPKLIKGDLEVRDPEEYRRLIHRLNRIEGQIRGIKGDRKSVV